MTDKEKDLFILENKLQGYQEAAKRVEADIKRHEVKKPFSYQELDRELREAFRKMLADQVDTNMASAEVVCACEVFELLEAVARGDYEDAQKELLHVMAVCIRFYEEIEKRKV